MKVFCVGRGKTGTTSMAQALRRLGFKLGSQAEAGKLLRDWSERDFRKLINFCETADAFQDTPFSLNYTFQAVDAAFPNSKFILTLRDSPEQWFRSLTTFHSNIFGAATIPPTVEDIKNFKGGHLLRAQKLIYGVDESDIYNPEIYMNHYVSHNAAVMDYFKYRPDDLLVINLAQPNAMKKICEFLGIEYKGQQLPHANKGLMAKARP